MNVTLVRIARSAKYFLLLLAFFVAPLVSAEIPKQNIPFYEVTITPNPDSSFSVEEVIYYDFARDYKHGITRTIPLKHPQESTAFYKNRYIDVTVNSVQKDDEDIPYEVTDQGDSLFLRVGDPNKTMTTEHKFTINYDVRGGLQYFEDSPTELYWDAIGSDSQVEIYNGVITVIDEHGLLTGPSSCYVGTQGSGNPCGELVHDGNTYVYTVSDLAKYTGATVAFALNDQVPLVIIEEYNWWYLIIPSTVIAIFALIYGLYRYRTKFKTGRPIIPQYEPYADLKPMYTGVLFDDTLHPHDITACIIYLAQQGYVKIKKTDRKFMWFFEVDDYELTLLRKLDSGPSRFRTEVLKLLFPLSSEPGERTKLSELQSNVVKQVQNKKILKYLKDDLKQDLVDSGYFQNVKWAETKPLLAFGGGVSMILFLIFAPFAVLFLAFVLLFLIASRRRTRKGYEALDHLKGFKDFLSTTEKERYKFHNAPEKSPEQFMQYLPYAVAFGVEKEWAKVFENITIPDPDWYDSSGAGSFSAVNLTNSVAAFSTAFASSSGSSSSGGSGGGGSVGGGGGGGSVGSW